MGIERGLLKVLLLVRSWTDLAEDNDSKTDQMYKGQRVSEVVKDEFIFIPDAEYFLSYVPEDVYYIPGCGIFQSTFKTEAGIETDQKIVNSLIISAQRWLNATGVDPQYLSSPDQRPVVRNLVSRVPFNLFLSPESDSEKLYVRHMTCDAIILPSQDIITSLYTSCANGDFRFSDTEPLKVLITTSDPAVNNTILLDSSENINIDYLEPIPGIRNIREGLSRILPVKLRDPELLYLCKYRVGQIAQEFAEVGYPALFPQCKET